MKIGGPLGFTGVRRMEARFGGGGLDWLDGIDRRIAAAMRRWGHPLLRWSLGIVFIWFGLLKPLGASAANELVERTVYWLPPEIFLPLLGWWEVAIGVCLLVRPLTRLALLLLFVQMPGTFLPLLLLPEVAFARFPFVPTIEGQYIVKNLVLISAGLVIGGTVRPAAPDPNRRRAARRDGAPLSATTPAVAEVAVDAVGDRGPGAGGGR